MCVCDLPFSDQTEGLCSSTACECAIAALRGSGYTCLSRSLIQTCDACRYYIYPYMIIYMHRS